MNTWAKVSFTMGVIGLTLIVSVIGDDALKYHYCQSSTSDSIWYSSDWGHDPFINLMLCDKESKTYWTSNACGSQRWLVKDTINGSKTYWTVLQRIDINK